MPYRPRRRRPRIGPQSVDRDHGIDGAVHRDLHRRAGCERARRLSYLAFSKNGAPLVFILNALHHGIAAQWVAAAAIVALPTVILVLMYGQSRIFFVMARDGLLPQSMATVHATRGTPVLMTVATGIVVAVIAAIFNLSNIALLANAGTLCAFIAVAASMLVLRMRAPDRPRLFRVPLPWLVGLVCISGCLYLFLNGLPADHTALVRVSGMQPASLFTLPTACGAANWRHPQRAYEGRKR